jgi:hypothetical protein
MKFTIITNLVVLLLLIPQTQSDACCIDVINYHMTIAKYSTGNDSAVVVNITDIAKPFKDSLLPTHLLSQLKMAYDTSKLVVVARISEYKSSFPELTTPGKVTYFTEFATISIDTILKGTMMQHQKTMTNEIDGIARILHYDTLNNRYDTIKSYLSITEPGYDFIKNKRFLIFAQKESNCFDLPLVDMCAMSTDAYVIDSNNQIYYDGVKINFANRKVTNIPFLKLRFSDFVDNLKPVRAVNNLTIKGKSNTSGISVSSFNLLGKKVSPITSYEFLTKSASSLFLSKSQNQKGAKAKLLLINNN